MIPAFPLIGFLFCGLLGARLPKAIVGTVATVAVFASFAIALGIFIHLGTAPQQVTVYLAPWISIPAVTLSAQPALQVNFELLIDPLSVMMMLIVTGVGGLIHLYSTGYMAADSGYSRFFTYLNLFIFFMLLLVMANNLLLLFVGWEGVGLCSYLLVGFWYEKQSAADAAKKAFIVNRVGDVGVLIGMFLAFQYFHTLDLYNGYNWAHGEAGGILSRAPELGPLIAASPFLAGIISLTAIMLFWGCTGKSAQLPLYTWLPDAMEGPTPVSALIHAATMVTAGVYLVARTHSLFELSDLAMMVVAVIGIATALFAATIGLVQNDIKRVLAYSTVSQLGYMFAACGVGAFAGGMFHVLTHAFFKACLFLGSGAVIHAMEHAIHARHSQHNDESAAKHSGGEPAAPALASGSPDPDDPQDMRNMGGLGKKLPIAAWTMGISTAAIAGIPLTSGFFSKDNILSSLAGHSWILWFVGVVTAVLTAIYMTRLMYKTFGGTPKTEDAGHAHGEIPSMSIPLVILGALALVGGLVWLPESWRGAFPLGGWLPSFLKPAAGSYQALHEVPDGALLAISSLVAIGGVAYAWLAYRAKDGRDLLIPAADKPRAGLYQLLLHKYYVDEIYNFIFVRGGKELATIVWKNIDVAIVDGAVNGVGSLMRSIGSAFRSWQTGYARNYAFSMLLGVLIVVLACLAGFHTIIHP